MGEEGGTSQQVIIVAGPTGSGKSALAIALAEHFDGVIINADAIQIYRDLRILTARPSPQEETCVPHRLYGILAGEERCSAARWRALALAEIATAHAAGRRAIVVGGTGLYLRVLMQGIAPVPAVPAAIRQAAGALYDTIGAARFHRRLSALDPVAAAKLAPADRQRLTRAWEVHQATGRPLSQWQEMAPDGDNPACTAFTLLPPREQLYQACDDRFVAMVEGGAMAEVEALVKRRLASSQPVMKAVGVRELMGYLRDEWSLEEGIRRGQQATRRYAKRQYTWFRNQLTDTETFHQKYSNNLLPEIFAKIS
ncbi:MAG: tRNA (adenosine(37)-N6)-dimethylallyltransferase MiaA [Alphaproteobacteria bacterium]